MDKKETDSSKKYCTEVQDERINKYWTKVQDEQIKNYWKRVREERRNEKMKPNTSVVEKIKNNYRIEKNEYHERDRD